MLYREIMAVCSQIHTKHINTLCGQNIEFLDMFAELPKATVSFVMIANNYLTRMMLPKLCKACCNGSIPTALCTVSLCKSPNSVSCLHSILLQKRNWVSFPGVKPPERGVDHPPPSTAEVKDRVEL